MTTLLNNAESKVNHLDSLRQRNLMIALGIFAGLIGFAPPGENSLMTFLVPVALLLIIILFWYVDHLLHKYSEGWQTTLITLAFKLGELINEPTKDVTFPPYDRGKERAKLYGPSARVYIFLAFGAVAFAVLRGLTKWSW